MQVYDAQGRPKRYQIPAALADGQVADTTAALYTSPAGVRTIVNKITLFNTNATAEVVNLFINGGTARQFRRVELDENESADVLVGEDDIVLEPGDALEADATTAAVVDFYVAGARESA